MRQVARAFLRRCRVSKPVAEFVVLTVSELVTNAVIHGEGEVVLQIAVAVDIVRVSVTDHNPVPAVLRKPDATVNPVAGSGLSRSQTLGRATARRRGVSSGTRGLRLESDL
ncbi:ATP-binding protein [Streptomyces sp. M10(2022)]